MSTFNNVLHAKCNIVARSGLCFVILTLVLFLSPAFISYQNVQAAIDEAMPSAIPAEVIADWKDQDKVSGSSYDAAIEKIVAGLPEDYKTKYDADKGKYSGEKLYCFAHHLKRVAKMKKHESDYENIMCMRHHNFGGFVVGYHDNADAGLTDDGWTAKGAMCLLEMKTYYPELKEILTKTDAVVRDPCISFDGKKVLFAMSGSKKGSGYKIYEMEIANPKNIKQLTTDPGVGKNVADFEPCYLPNGDIAFTSTRCFGFVDCAQHPVTNMFIMSGEGKHIRQVGFDQVNTFYPVLTDEGVVMYTRWEYNDRDLTNSMGVFTMNPDGAHQTEWFGNQIAFPMTIIHARPIQGQPNKIVAIASGHHAPYSGELMIIDKMAGTSTNDVKSVKMICPVRATKPDATSKTDIAAGGVYFTYQNPYGIDDNSILVSWRKSESGNFKLFLMDTTGSRELLAWADQSISQPVIVKARKTPAMIAQQADYTKDSAEFTVQDVYYGEGMKGIAKGTAKSLRVVRLHYRVQDGDIGTTMGSGPKGAFVPAIFCPISLYGASWEAKEVLGETPIFPDGSASFKVPPRAPLYFQILDSLGYCIATMRSWSTLMPGEKFPCAGCHENKLISPPPGQIPQAGDPKPLEKTLDIENKIFDYAKMVQPILDKHCISCHKGSHESGFDLSGTLKSGAVGKRSAPTSYTSLLKGIPAKTSNNAVNINTIFSTPEQQAPYSFGACKSNIMTKVLNGTSHTDKIKTGINDKEKRIIACWIDLCAPLCGNDRYFSASDSSSYAKELAIKEKWMKIEKEGLPTGIVTPDNKGIITSNFISTQRFSIGYVPTQRSLVLNNPGQGHFILVDLMGNVISRTKLSNQIKQSTVSISLPASLSTGCYLARFEGANGVQQTKFTFTK